jgi:hypothetical protein
MFRPITLANTLFGGMMNFSSNTDPGSSVGLPANPHDGPLR